MRREFTAISAFSMTISFVAAIVLCVQVAQLELPAEWRISGPILWALEAAVFGAAVYAWRSDISLAGWLVGILGLTAIRLMVSTAAAFGLAALLAEEDLGMALGQTFVLAPRLAAVVFSVMTFYPLRAFLPARPPIRRGGRRRFGGSEAARLGAGEGANGEQPVVLVTGNEKVAVWEDGEVPDRPRRAATLLADVDVSGAVEVPLSAVLQQVPRELWGERARQYQGTERVAIPLSAIVPQLPEAQVLVSLADLQGWLPTGAMKAPATQDRDEGSSMVSLPLELIVPLLPPEVLALPEPSPPRWAQLEPPGVISFATV